MYHRRIMQEAFIRTGWSATSSRSTRWPRRSIANDWVANEPRFLLYPAMKELTLDIASMVFMGHEPGTDRELVTKVNRAFTATTRAGNAIIRTSVPPFTLVARPQAREYLEDYFEARVQGTPRQGRLGHVHRAVSCGGRGRQQVHRRGHRQPHDLPDDGRARHVDVDRDDDVLLPGGAPGMAGSLPRRVRPARRRPARHRGAGEAGNARPGDQRDAPNGIAGPVGNAPGRARHRDARPLPPQGHERHRHTQA